MDAGQQTSRSQPVDVLAIIEKAARSAECLDGTGIVPVGRYIELQQARAAVAELIAAAHRAERLLKEALPKFNWGVSALDANAIQLLNEVPGEVRAALAACGGAS